MTTINPFIKFNDGKCREAMTFYKQILGGELEFMTIKGSPLEAEFPPEKLELIMHSTLTNGNMMLIGSDIMMDKATIGDNVGVSLSFESQDEIKRVFDGLSEGGEVFAPLKEEFWGALFAIVTDKYGVEWMLNCPTK